MNFLDMALESLERMGLKDTSEEIIPSLREEKFDADSPSGLCVDGETDRSVVSEHRFPTLEKYLALLQVWKPENAGNLPPVPPFRERPERPIAWSAWWSAVERQRANALHFNAKTVIKG